MAVVPLKKELNALKRSLNWLIASNDNEEENFSL